MTDELAVAGGFAAALLGGMAFGAFYFVLLWRGMSGFVQTAVDRRRGIESLLRGLFARLLLACGSLGIAIWAGADAKHLLIATLGFTLARHAAIRRRHRQG